MTPERAFILWFANKQFMVVKKHRPEIRAHIIKALAQVDRNPEGKKPQALSAKEDGNE